MAAAQKGFKPIVYIQSCLFLATLTALLNT